MIVSTSPPDRTPDSSSPSHIYTLEPLLAEGQAALALHPADTISGATLTATVVVWHNAFNEVTIRKADDLFACAAMNGHCYDPIPKGAELAQATLELQFTDKIGPSTIQILPPHTLNLRDPAEAPRVLAWLRRRGFCLKS